MSELGEDIRQVVLDEPMMSMSTADNARQLQASRCRLRMSQKGLVPPSNTNSRIVCSDRLLSIGKRFGQAGNVKRERANCLAVG